MKAIMQVSARDGHDVPVTAIAIDAFGLAVVFSSLTESSHSKVYTYEGVQFWRANDAFVVSYNDTSFVVKTPVELEAFQQLLRDQKAS